MKSLSAKNVSAGDIYDGIFSSRPDDAFSAACRARNEFFGNRIFLYGFLYISTHCVNDCQFCQYRRGNSNAERYRKTLSECLEAARGLADEGVHLLDLTLGEDPFFTVGDGFERLLEFVSAVRAATGLPVMVSPGVLDAGKLAALRLAGADWYACYQETHDRTLFARLRTGQDFDLRRNARLEARKAGLLVEDGLLAGIGEGRKEIIRSLDAMRKQDLAQARAMAYVPHACTLKPEKTDNLERELRLLAAMRLLMPDRLVPASLDVEGIDGLKARLGAGANVVTSIIPPSRGFCGVASPNLDIDNQRRSIAAVVRILKQEGLEPATPSEYQAWMAKCRENLKRDI